jgi:hypothetical protein
MRSPYIGKLGQMEWRQRCRVAADPFPMPWMGLRLRVTVGPAPRRAPGAGSTRLARAPRPSERRMDDIGGRQWAPV